MRDNIYGLAKMFFGQKDSFHFLLVFAIAFYLIPHIAYAAQCGYANDNEYSSAPQAIGSLCSAGTPSSVSGTGPWTWTCTDGATASCIASRCGGPPPSAGACNTATVNGCSSGSAINISSDANNDYWYCSGTNGGADSTQCAKAKPSNSQCTWVATTAAGYAPPCGTGSYATAYSGGACSSYGSSCSTGGAWLVCRNMVTGGTSCAPATYSYVWEIGAWSAYGSCTGGTAPAWGMSPTGNYTIFSTGGQKTRTRSVICKRSDGTTVADSFCSGTKPVSSDTPVACATRELIAVAGSGYGSFAWTSARIPGSCTGTVLFDGDASFDNTDGYTPLNLLAQYGGGCAINWHTKTTSTSALTHKFRIYSGKYTTSGTMADVNSNLASWCASYNASKGGGCGFSINGEVPY